MRLLLLCLAGVLAIAAFHVFSPLQERNDAATERSSSPREAAFALHRQGRYAEAGRIYDRLVEKDGGDNDILFWRAVARRYEGRHEDALADFRRVIEVDPRRYEAHMHADRVLAEQKRFAECLELWNRFLEVVPAHKDGLFERSRAHAHLGDFAAALADARGACELGRMDACPVARDLESKMGDATRKAAP